MRMTRVNSNRSKLSRVLCAFLCLCLALAPMACDSPSAPPTDPGLEAFLNDTGGPAEPRESDALMKGKADVLVLPAISVTVWAVGALLVYIGTTEVFSNTIQDFQTVLDTAFGGSADWDWAEEMEEPLNQADHLTESLNRIAYRSETSDFYSVNGNDYLRFLNMVDAITFIDPRKLNDLLDGKVRPWGQFVKDYFASLQVASMHARHLSQEQDGAGLCARATVTSRIPPFESYVGLAQAKGPIDVIPAVIFASFKATMRCGMYDSDIREYIYSYFDVGGPLDALPDVFISQMLKSASLLYKIVDKCEIPPKIVVDMDGGDCFDVTLH